MPPYEEKVGNDAFVNDKRVNLHADTRNTNTTILSAIIANAGYKYATQVFELLSFISYTGGGSAVLAVRHLFSFNYYS